MLYEVITRGAGIEQCGYLLAPVVNVGAEIYGPLDMYAFAVERLEDALQMAGAARNNFV